MTMASFLHVQSSYISQEQIAHYLQMIQSSSPSYPLMASLDMARHYLANLSGDEIQRVLESVQTLRNIWKKGKHWHIVESDDPLKITLQVRKGLSGFDLASAFEEHSVYPELATDTQVLLIHGIKGFDQFTRVEKIVNSMNEQYKYRTNHATIEVSTLFHEPMKELAVSYLDMYSLPKKKVPIEQAIGLIAAEAIIPYPPGIPVILKGERITEEQIRLIHHLIKQGATIQHQDMEQGIQVFG